MSVHIPNPSVITDPDVARRALKGETMRNLAQDFGRELVETQRKLSKAERRIGELERELDLADAEIHRLREGR